MKRLVLFCERKHRLPYEYRNTHRANIAKNVENRQGAREIFYQFGDAMASSTRRYCFGNLVRQGFMNALSYRLNFDKGFNFKEFNRILIELSYTEIR